MKAKYLLILVAVCAVLGAGVYFIKEQGKSSAVSDSDYPVVTPSSIEQIEVQTSTGGTTLVKTGGIWTVTEKQGFPADFSKVKTMVENLTDVTIGRSFPADEATTSRLKLTPPDKSGINADQMATRVTLKDSASPILSVLIGSTRKGGGQYLKLEPGNKVLVAKESIYEIDRPAAEWIQTELFKIPETDITSIALFTDKPETPAISLTRPSAPVSDEVAPANEKGAEVSSGNDTKQPPPLLPLTLVSSVPDGRTIDTGKVKRIGRLLETVTIKDIADTKADLSGKPKYLFYLANGGVVTITLGDKAENSENEFIINIDTEGDVDITAGLDVSKHSYLMDEWKYNQFVTDISELFQDVPENDS